MSTIGDRLRELRGKSSQREMAEAIGIKWNAWARYEAGGSLPGADILARICRVHACSADWLLGLRDSAPPREPSIKTGANSAVAVGANARATVRTAAAPPGALPACAKCPYKKKLKQFEVLLKK